MSGVRNSAATCSTCPYWHRAADVDNDGECRRHAPRVVTQPECHPDAYTATEHPKTADDEWCGEHPDFLIASGRPR